MPISRDMANRRIYVNVHTLTLYEKAVHHLAQHHNSSELLCKAFQSWPDVLVMMLQ